MLQKQKICDYWFVFRKVGVISLKKGLEDFARKKQLEAYRFIL